MDFSTGENMETTEQSYDSVGNVQESQDSSSCSCSDKQLVLPSKKRSANFFTDDEGSCLSKYRKLTEQRITALAEEKPAYAISTSDISSDELSNTNDNKNSEKTAFDSVLNESSETCNFDCASNGNMSAREKCEKFLETASESDGGGSMDISPQKELPIIDSAENTIKEKQKIRQKLSFISSISKIHSSTFLTSQFSCNNESEEKHTEVNDLPTALKEINSQISNSEHMEQDIDNAELPNISVHEEIVPGTSSESSTVHDYNTHYVNKEANIKEFLSNEQFSVIEEPSDKNSDISMKRNDSNIMEISEVQSEIAVQNNVDNLNNTLNKNDNQENGTNDKSFNFYQSKNLNQSSCVKDEQNINSQTNIVRSVSELNLAQLVLSLKEDIQELSKKIEKQENVLDAIVHVNEISLAPLFTQSFPEKYNLNIPFNTIEEFDKFNQDLAKDIKFHNEFITSLCSYIDNNVSLAKNILTMLKKYMTKELASLYTASKATANKMVLKDTTFCKCLLYATKMTIKNGLLPLEHEKAFMKGLGVVVSGAKGWHTAEEEKKQHG